MTVIIDGSASAEFETPLPVAEGGTGATASTGSGNVVLSASPTLTGTVTTAAITASGTLTANAGSNSFAHLGGTVYSNGGARALNTNYTNSSAYDKIIYVSVSNASASALMIVVLDGDTIYGSSDPTAGAYYSATFIWPAGKLININMNGTPTLQRWVEYA